MNVMNIAQLIDVTRFMNFYFISVNITLLRSVYLVMPVVYDVMRLDLMVVLLAFLVIIYLQMECVLICVH